MQYGGYYPATYQSPIQYGQNQINPIYPQQNTGIIWVQGEVGARAYPNPPLGQNMLLMDSENQRFFIKSTDQNGIPMPLRKFRYSEEVDQPVQEAQPEYVTRKEFEEYIQSMKDTSTEVIVPKSRRKENE